MKKVTKGRLILFLGLVVLGLTAWVLWRGVSFYREEGKRAVHENETMEKGFMKHIHLTSTRGGQVIWALDAVKAQLVGDEVHLWDVRITYYLKSRRPLLIYGREGLLNRRQKKGEIWGDVRMMLGSECLTVNRLYWDTKRNLVSSPLPFHVRGRYQVDGVGFVAQPSAEWVKVRTLKKAVFR